MAATFADAIASVEGPRFDEIVGYSIAPPRTAPTDPAIREVFSGIDYARFRRLERMLSGRYGCHIADAEDAVHEAFVELYETRRNQFLKPPETWLGLLYGAARFRLVGAGINGDRATSLERDIEAVGDALLSGAAVCAPEVTSAWEGARLERRPQRGEKWSPSQVLGALQRFRDFYGRPPRIKDCRAIHGLPAPTAIYRLYGTLANALLEAGMVPETLGKRRRRWEAVEAAEACKAFRDRNGRWPDWRDVKECPEGLPGTSAMVRLLGGTRAIDVQLGSQAILALIPCSGDARG